MKSGAPFLRLIVYRAVIKSCHHRPVIITIIIMFTIFNFVNLKEIIKNSLLYNLNRNTNIEQNSSEIKVYAKFIRKIPIIPNGY